MSNSLVFPWNKVSWSRTKFLGHILVSLQSNIQNENVRSSKYIFLIPFRQQLAKELKHKGLYLTFFYNSETPYFLWW